MDGTEQYTQTLHGPIPCPGFDLEREPGVVVREPMLRFAYCGPGLRYLDWLRCVKGQQTLLLHTMNTPPEIP